MLTNDLNIAFEKYNSPGIMAAKLWIRDGSRADPINLKGCHQILGATLCRGCGPYNNHKIADIVEGCGASLRCETYEDGLLISLKCINSDAYKLLPILGWMIKLPHVDIDQISLEKDLTIKALQRQRENPFHIAFDGWRQIAYNSDGYGHDPLGTEKDLINVNKKEVSILANSLINRKKILVIAGSYPEDLEKKIKEIIPYNELIDSRKASTYINKANTKSIKHINNKTLYLHHVKTQQIVLLLGKPTISHGHQDALALRLLSFHLGYGMSSFLFTTLREKYGVVYEVGVYHPVRELKSPFVVHASTSEEKASLTFKLLKECWQKTLEIRLTEKELLLSKSKLKGQLALSLQSISQKAERKAHLIGLGLNAEYDEETPIELDKLTSEDLYKIANTHLKNPLLSICGPKQNISKLVSNW